MSVSACSSCSAVRDCVMLKHTCTGKWQHTCSPGLCMLWKNFPRSPMGNGNVSERWCAGSCFRAVSERFQASLGLSLVSLQFFLQKREIERESTNKVKAPKNSKKRKTRNTRKERMGRRETEQDKGFGKKRLNLPRTQRVVTRSWWT